MFYQLLESSQLCIAQILPQVGIVHGIMAVSSEQAGMPEASNFQNKMLQICIDGMLAAGIALGTRLQLFQALAKVGSDENPASAAQVAEESGCKERYIKEWLALMAVGDIITVTKDEKFFIKKEHIAELTSGVALFNSFLTNFLRPYDKLCDVIKKDGPNGLDYSDFTTECCDVIANFTQANHKKYLLTHLLPDVGFDLKEKLQQGGMKCLDVGCGKGFHAALLADHFPKSHFTGIDVTANAIQGANLRRKSDGQPYNNLTFFHTNGAKMDDSWTNTFDLVTIFDACHDQTRPDLCLKEIHRVLRPGGVFAMVEINGTSNIYKDKEQIGRQAAMQYGASLFHCLPVGNNSKDALGLGAMWGKERAVKLLQEAGFNDITVVPTPYFKANVLYVSKKT